MSRKITSSRLQLARVVALADFDAIKSEELTFKTGDIFEFIGIDKESGWAYGEKDQKKGWFPFAYVTRLEGKELEDKLNKEVRHLRLF